MQNSRMMALLVTPNLLEMPGGKPNFVMGEEYPAAKELGMQVLPAEMVKTDREALCEKYEDIPPCVDPREDAALGERLAEALCRIAFTGNDADPEHNFLIGLAYLDGIDVETDREKGVALITAAAEADLPEAMEKLYTMYRDGAGVNLDYRKAAFWAECLAEHLQKALGEEHPDTLAALHNLAFICENNGEHQKARDLLEKVYALRCKILGEEHPATLTSMSNLAVAYSKLDKHKKALDLKEKAYALSCKILGEEHPRTLTAINNLAVTYDKLGERQKALETQEEVYALSLKLYGEEHPQTVKSKNRLAEYREKAGG